MPGDGRERYAGWWNDTADGAVAVMIAATDDDVVALSARARMDRVAVGLVEHDGVELDDGSTTAASSPVGRRRASSGARSRAHGESG